jgi:phosphatidylserine/phosphatidylglycerophosphate/cardiolipin synthase-like enzyme
VQAYGFTNKAILKALVEAHQRGVDVKGKMPPLDHLAPTDLRGSAKESALR